MKIPVDHQEFYHAVIGPIDRRKLDRNYPNGEGDCRAALDDAFMRVAGHYADSHASGWGVKPEQLGHISFAAYDDDLKKAVVDSYLDEKKKMPDHIEAWYLLLQKRKRTKKK